MQQNSITHSVKQASSNWTEKERAEILGHMTFSFESFSSAEKILNAIIEKEQVLTKEDVQRMVVSLNKALSESSLVTDKALYKVHPELPKQFREKYQIGLSSLSQGVAERDKKKLSRGDALLQAFKKWLGETRSSFSYPPK